MPLTTEIDLRVKVLLSTQRALLGAITSEMRAISVMWSARAIRLRVYIDGPIREDLVDEFEAGAATQIAADFPDIARGDPMVSPCEFIRADEPTPIAASDADVFVFARCDRAT